MQQTFRKRIYVKVRADHLPDGSIRPLMFREADGPTVVIDRVANVCQAASTKVGGQGIRYTCRIQGREIHLFQEKGDGSNRWFIEAPLARIFKHEEQFAE